MTTALPKAVALLALLGPASSALRAAEHHAPTFKKITLSEEFYSEGCTFGDFNHDGTFDFAAGPFWYAGPDFQKRHTIYDGSPVNPAEYSRNFLNFAYDFNGDGWTDIFVVGFPGAESPWFENPKGEERPWTRHVAYPTVDNESPRFADLTGDGKPELICMAHGHIGWAEPNWANPTEPWKFHKATAKPDGRFQRFTHGLGYGDINGDGRVDLIEHKGWYEQPASLAGDPEWTFHPADFGGGGAQMYTYDVDGDRDADVITSLRAHEYGLAWFEQRKGDDGKISFQRHLILSDKPGEKMNDVQFSQPHAVALVDMDNDGLKDLITGKRYWAHGAKGDPEPQAEPVLYWFKLTRDGGKPVYTPHRIDNDSGVGTQVTVGDINGDGKPDVMVGNKRGQFVFIQEPVGD